MDCKVCGWPIGDTTHPAYAGCYPDECTYPGGRSDKHSKEKPTMPATIYVAWRIESHRDREMTFLGAFSTEEAAEEWCREHCDKQPYHRPHEYTVREARINEKMYW